MARAADVVVFLDDVQYTRRDWRNRNLIRGERGPRWITIPVLTSGKYTSRICDIELASDDWVTSHLSILDQTYRNCRPYQLIRDKLTQIYLQASRHCKLTDVNQTITRDLFEILDIHVEIRDSREFPTHDDPTERLVAICTAIGATTYLSGPAAKAYLREDVFVEQGLHVEWSDYDSLLPVQTEISVGVELSILDLLAVVGTADAEMLSTFHATRNES
jgi:hypothetical protein